MINQRHPPRIWRLCCLLLCLASCATNPETGRSQFIVLREDREISLGEQAAPKFLEDYGGPINSQSIRDYVRIIGLRLARLSSRPLLPWQIEAVDSATINAFALPGGKVFVTRGLLAKLRNEAQLAGVLGHEIAHVTARHVNDHMAQKMGLQIVLAGINLASRQSNEQWLGVLGTGTEVGGSLFILKFSREDELEADDLGLRYMTKLGYNPMAQIQVMQILNEQRASTAQTMAFLSTHPLPKQRVDNLKQLIQRNYPDHESSTKYGFYELRYVESVLETMASLGPPKHTTPKTPPK